MQMQERSAVTGAFGFTGKYIAARLLAQGAQVLTLTDSPHRPNPFGPRIETTPFHFNDPGKLVCALRGVSVLYNTYWVRFNSRATTHEEAVRHTQTLFLAAQAAGVRRIVHISITHADEASSSSYFRQKARLERMLAEMGISHAILRPACIFGEEDILINNMAWSLRGLPLFGLFGDGNYTLQPIFVDDLAQLAVEQGAATGNRCVDAVGPETLTYRELVRLLGLAIGCPRRTVCVPPAFGYAVTRLLGWLLRDRMMTWDEVQNMMANKLSVKGAAPVGSTRLTEWIHAHADQLGRRYASEWARRRDRTRDYRTTAL